MNAPRLIGLESVGKVNGNRKSIRMVVISGKGKLLLYYVKLQGYCLYPVPTMGTLHASVVHASGSGQL